MTDRNHAHLSIRDAHLSYVRGCRCTHCTKGHAAYQLENRRARAREGVRATVRHENGQMDIFDGQVQEPIPAHAAAAILSSGDDQGLRTASSPSVGLHHRGADKNERAAAKRQVKSPEKREDVLLAIVDAGHRGLTRHEIVGKTGIPLQTVCGRVGECLKEENRWVYKSKMSREGRGVLVATERGIEEARRIRDRRAKRRVAS